MYLKRISLTNFKNIGDASLEFSPKINCINGNNGQGKTNLLDAIYYLSMLKSFFQSNDQYTFKYGENQTTIVGTYICQDDVQEQISVSINKGGDKCVRRGKKAYSKFSEHIGMIPIVMISPFDTVLINDSGEERRKFLNRMLSQTDKSYLQHLQSYNTLLLHRNKILKEDVVNNELLEMLSLQMMPHADYIYKKRCALCEELGILTTVYYQKISECSEEVSLKYNSDLHKADIVTLLEQEVAKESILKYTTVGIHRDDMILNLGGHPIKKCGSQGQQKSLLIALKLAQYELMCREYKYAPILLLDDLFDKLDMARIHSLMGIVSSYKFGQIFITDSNKVRLSEIVSKFDAPANIFVVENGIYKVIDNEER